eukprot:gene33406-41221_t
MESRSGRQVLYPVVSDLTPAYLERIGDRIDHFAPYVTGYDQVFVSLNRYERKKNISLALDAANHLKTRLLKDSSDVYDTSRRSRILLVVAGGYDVRVRENVEYLLELISHCELADIPHKYVQSLTYQNNDGVRHKHTPLPCSNACGVSVDIVFRVSISSDERTALLLRASGLLYTPDCEHFGIVPLEAMYLSTPVIAVNSGGPRETVLDGKTGYLCEQNAREFAIQWSSEDMCDVAPRIARLHHDVELLSL